MIAGLKQQYEVLKRRRADLTLRSPIAGAVLTWNTEELLTARPVCLSHRTGTVTRPV